MAKKDLIPNSERTPEELHKMAVDGGVASGKARKKKADLKERLEIMLEIFKKDQKKVLSKESIEKLDAMGADVYTIMNILFGEETKDETKLVALDKIWDRIEGKAGREVTLNHRGGIETGMFGDMSTKELKGLRDELKGEIAKARKLSEASGDTPSEE